MKPTHQEQTLLKVLDAILAGTLSAADAADGGIEPEWRTVFEIAQHLGHLERGQAVTFTAEQASMLHAMIECGVTRLESEAEITTIKQAIADGLTGIAFNLDDPIRWACNLGQAIFTDMPQTVMPAHIEIKPTLH